MPSNTSANDSEPHIYYYYTPSLAAAILFTMLFFLTTSLHIYQGFQKRAWFLIPLLIGGVFESIGYIGRILSSQNQQALPPYIMQTLLLLLAPVLFAATIYMILGRIILLTEGDRFTLVRRTWITKIFVGGDVLSFLTQGAGAGMLSSGHGDKDKEDLGKYLIVAGLFIQVAFFGFFLAVAFMFQMRGRGQLQSIAAQVPWRKHLFTLNGTSALILVRFAFRVAGYIQGNDGYLLRHEVFLYVFDSLLMFAVMVAMNVVHPGDIAPMLREKSTEAKGEELGVVKSSEGNLRYGS